MTATQYLKNKALELLTVAACVVTVGYISQNFVSANVYAEDQAGIVAAISQIVPALKLQLTIERLTEQIKDIDNDMLRLNAYMEADPDSRVSAARHQELRRLANLKEQVQRELTLETLKL